MRTKDGTFFLEKTKNNTLIAIQRVDRCIELEINFANYCKSIQDEV